MHFAARSGKFESIETILALYPEAEHLQALTMTTHYGETVLHLVANSNKIEGIKATLSLFPESQRLEAANTHNANRETVLDKMDAKTRITIMEWLSKSESSVSKQPQQHLSN